MADFIGFRNRLRKNLRHWGRWARRRAISCYRVYDREMPDFPLAIDLYEGRPHVQEYATDWEATEEEYARWVRQTKDCVAEVLTLPPEGIAFKRRRRQKGRTQYEKTGLQGEDFVVQEGGLKFWVNLHAYLDTGLFLDHRRTRALVRSRAAGRRFLNLFAYTGSFTVYAAAGGARESVTVDLSKTYQDWTRRNLELNGIDLTHHRLQCADVFVYLEQAAACGERFDLVVLDPPTFSNSKRMRGILDVQRDHPRLINGALRLLNPGGELFFSTNRRRFTLQAEAIDEARIEEITHQTLPEDFARARAHRCWRIQRL